MNSDLSKIILIVLAGCVLVYVINSYNKQNLDTTSEEEMDTFLGTMAEEEMPGPSYADSIPPTTSTMNIEKDVTASEPTGQNEIYKEVSNNDVSNPFGLNGNQYPKDCFPKDQLSPGELLPGDANSKWAQVNPSGQGELGDQNFLSAGYHVGVNTVGQTLRNPNLQLRSEPPNPQMKVSPWLQTTIEPDSNRRPMEIGGC